MPEPQLPYSAPVNLGGVTFNTTTNKVHINPNNGSPAKEISYADKYLKITILPANNPNPAATERIVTFEAVPQPSSSAPNTIQFAIRKGTGHPELQIVKHATNNTWYFAIGTSDVRIERNRSTGVGKFNLEHTTGPIIHFSNGIHKVFYS